MWRLFSGILLVGVFYTDVAYGQAFSMEFVSVDATVEPNPWIESAEGWVKDKKGSLRMNVVETFPEDMMVSFQATFGDLDLPPYEGKVCDIFLDKVVGADIIAAGIPKDSFPQECPVEPGEFTIDSFQLKDERVPPGLGAEGNDEVSGSAELFMPGEKPLLKAAFTGKLIPKAGVPGLGRK